MKLSSGNNTQEKLHSFTDSVLITVKDVAALTALAERTIWRFADSGKIPRPVHIGGAVRWRKSDLLSWIENGCPPCRTARV